MNNLFGTDGIRNLVGNYPFTSEDLPKLGKALAAWIIEKYGPNCKILVAQDTRQSCAWVKASLKSGLLLYPITIVDAQILPTPGIFHLIKADSNYSCGIVISASHNPYFDNGIKIIDSKTGKLNKDDENRILELISQNQLPIDYNNMGTEVNLTTAQDLYINSVVSLFNKQFLQNKKIVLDLAHGATYQVAQKIFELLGAKTIVINNNPDGYNINKDCGSLHLKQLQQIVIQNKADAGFAFDGDGDRVVAINRAGLIKDGDDILSILSDHPDYTQINSLVGTILTNKGLESYLNNKNKKLIRTAVGDKHIVEALNTNNLLLGGEQSGHLILKNILNTGDGILTALKVLQALELSGNWDMKTFEKYPQFNLNIPVKIKKNLQESPFVELIDEAIKKLNNGRIIVRYSGTEYCLRILAEDTNIDQAKLTVNSLAEKLQLYLT